MSEHAWTAEEVYELVKDWPDEAKPDWLMWLPQSRRWEHFDGGMRLESEAAALHVASGLHWLIVNGFAPLFRPDGNGGYELKTRGATYGPTELHAISAAIREVSR